MMTKIHYKLEDEVALIRMDDGKANAMDFLFFDEMNKWLDRLEEDGAKTLIITGRPGYFSGGLDIKLMPTLSPTDTNALAEAFARTMLRVFSLPVPTIAVCSGHAVAGGAMLIFSCDLRFAVEGPYRIQMNETMIGIPFPSWMLLIGQSAIPVQWFVETFLLAKACSPVEVVERGMFQGLIKKEEDVMAYAKAQTENLKTLSMHAYRTSKNRLRTPGIEHVLRLLKAELPFKEA
jgi:enoyl-CoA hydratase